jgi:alpha-L-rhamnosidase
VGLKPIELRISGLKDPIGLDEQQPYFGWQFDAGHSYRRRATQSAYRVLVASSETMLNKDKGDFWDSRKTNNSNYTHVSGLTDVLYQLDC